MFYKRTKETSDVRARKRDRMSGGIDVPRSYLIKYEARSIVTLLHVSLVGVEHGPHRRAVGSVGAADPQSSSTRGWAGQALASWDA